MRNDDSIPENFEEQLKAAVANDRACIYGEYSEDGILGGIAFFGKASKRINFVFADGNVDIEKRLFNALFERFKNDYSHIASGGRWISEELSEHIIEIGFAKYDRMSMTLSRRNIENLAEPKLSKEMSFEPYSPNLRDEISHLVFEGTNGHVDQNVFPDFFSSVEDCKRLLENIEANRFGDYRESSSWILYNNSVAIGVCFMTVRNGDTGYIPDIVVKGEFRGKGLGKAILVQSMKQLVESEPALTKVDLDVTLSNNAKYLYKSLGFEKVQENSTYTWKKH
ncbi:MAG: GNAT family N-acetyltransferase [Candidatus Thorarchaeota archaeon]